MNSLTILLIAVAIIVILIIIFNNNNLNINELINKYYKNENDSKDAANVLKNYTRYEMTINEKIKYFLVGAFFLFSIGFLFYRSIPLSLLVSLLALKYPAIKEKDLIKKQQNKLLLEFKDALYAIFTSLSAGSPAENAIIESIDDLKQMYIHDDAFIIKEFSIFKNKIKMNESIDYLLRDFAKRSGLEEVENFTEVFITSFKTGGNQAEMIKNTIDIIVEKIEIKREIQMMIAEKKYEQKVMNIMPLFIVLFLSVSASDYFRPMFTHIAGRIIMTIVLMMLGVGVWISNKIMNIEME